MGLYVISHLHKVKRKNAKKSWNNIYLYKTLGKLKSSINKITFVYPGDEMNEAHTSIYDMSDDCTVITRNSGDITTLIRK